MGIGHEDAVAERKELGTSLRKLASKYNIPRNTLFRHISGESKGSPIGVQGRKSVFTQEESAELTEFVTGLAYVGFLMTLRAVGDLVESNVQHNDHTNARKVFKYKGHPGYSGPDWLKSLLVKNNLSLKEATKLSVVRYNATKNPFIIYNHFDQLEAIMNDYNLCGCPDLIWNCDESGLPHEPKKCKVVSAKGQKTLHVISGIDRENTTVMVACSVSGVALPHLSFSKAGPYRQHGNRMFRLTQLTTPGYTRILRDGWTLKRSTSGL